MESAGLSAFYRIPIHSCNASKLRIMYWVLQVKGREKNCLLKLSSRFGFFLTPLEWEWPERKTAFHPHSEYGFIRVAPALWSSCTNVA